MSPVQFGLNNTLFVFFSLSNIPTLNFIPSSHILQYDLKNRRQFLKRSKTELTLADLYIGSTIAIHSRQFKVVNYGDDYTRKALSSKKERLVPYIIFAWHSSMQSYCLCMQPFMSGLIISNTQCNSIVLVWSMSVWHTVNGFDCPEIMVRHHKVLAFWHGRVRYYTVGLL